MLRRVTAVVRTPALVRNTPLAMGSLRTLATVSGPGQPAAAGRPRRDEHSPRSAAFSPLAAPSARRGNTGSGYTRLPRSSTDGSSDGDGAMLRSKRGGAANVSPSPTTTTHASAYRTHFPAARAIYDTPPTRRPYETILTIRKKVRVSATGKHMKFDAYCLAGDRCGSVGYAHATSTQANKAVQTALRLARGRMRHYPLFEGRTLFHDMEARHRKLRIGLWAKPAGYSVRAQHTIYDLCMALGIQDLAAKIQHGATTNPVTITKVFLHALAHQHRTPEEVAKVRGKRVVDVYETGYGSADAARNGV